MTQSAALVIGVAIMAFVATYIVVGPLAVINTQLWAVFISWAAFVFAGGGTAGLRATLPALIFGAAVGWGRYISSWRHQPALIQNWRPQSPSGSAPVLSVAWR